MGTDYWSGDCSLINRMVWHAQSAPDRVFCACGDTTTSYGAVMAIASQVANGLRAAGVRKGDTVAVYLPNSLEFFYARFGSELLGAVFVPVSTQFTEDELGYQLAHSRARALIGASELLPKVQAVRSGCPALGTVVSIGDTEAPGVARLSDFVSHEATETPATPLSADDLAMIMYTSGTTARPKGVMFSHGNVLTSATKMAAVLQWSNADRYLLQYPMFLGLGGLTGIAPAILVGATVVLIPRFTASRFVHLVREYGITICELNATSIRYLLSTAALPADSQHQLSRVLLALSLEKGEIVEFERRFGTRLCPAYGMTETLSCCASVAPSDPARLGSAGRVLPGYSLRIVDEVGNDVPAGVVGEILVSHAQRRGLSVGYFRDADATASAFQDGWLHTGDLGSVDNDGYVWFRERKKDVLKRSGFMVSPAELESVIAEVDGVDGVAVVGIPDHFRDETVVAFVVRDHAGSVSEGDIIARCRSQLAEYKLPQEIRFIESLPTSPDTGKVQKAILRQMASQPHTVNAGDGHA